MAKRVYIVYDGRAAFGDTDDATVCCCADSLREARRDVKEDFPDGVIYSYIETPDGELIDERREE